MKKKIGISATGVLILLAALLLSACGAQAQKVERTVTMKEFAFEPETVEVPAGAEVTLHLSNTGALEHEYVIIKPGQQVTLPFDIDDEEKVYWEKELDKGLAETVTFTAPDEPGEYTVVCGTPGHLEAGMQARLVVTG